MKAIQKTAVFLFALAAFAESASAFTVEYGGPRYCVPETRDYLAGLGLSESEIDSVEIITQQRSGRSGLAIESHQAWVKLKSCRGDLVLELRPHCHLIQAYTRGDCQVAGVNSCRD